MATPTHHNLKPSPRLHPSFNHGPLCFGDNLARSLEVRSDGTGTYLFERCADCGACFEDSRQIGWSL